jgi:esterase
MTTLDLAHNAFGSRGPAVIVLHGLLGSARNWTTISKRLGESRRVFALDLRNHGASPWAAAMTYDDMAEDVRRFIEQNDLDPVSLIGHSMGGKVAMRLALLYHDLVERLVVVDVAPVVYQHSFDDYIDAMRAVDLARVSRRAEVDAALARAIPEFGVRAFLMQNLARDDDGFVWRLNLDAIAMSMDDILGWPEAGAARFEGETLVLAGARSDYVRPEHRPLFEQLFPAARLEWIEGSGHWVHAEKPDRFLEAVTAFLG